MKYTLLFFSCLLFTVNTYAQQLPQYTMSFLDVTTQNPASVGMESEMLINGVFRSQWVSFPGAPVTVGINAHTPLYLVGGGLGLQFSQDSYGAEQILNGAFAYSKHFSIKESLLGIGARVGFNQHQLDGSLLRTATGDYSEQTSVVLHNDEILPSDVLSATGLNYSAGLYYKHKNIEAGVSVLQFTEKAWGSTAFSFTKKRHYFMSLLGNIPLSYNLELQPALQVRSDLAETQVDFSVLATYEEKFSLGGGYRGYNSFSSDAASVMLGVKVKPQLQVYYSYDIGLSALNVSNSIGSHEILLVYRINTGFGSGRLPNIIYNPRIL